MSKTKNLLESVNSVLSGQKLQEASYIDKRNNKAANVGQLEDLIASELDIASMPSDELKDLLVLFKKGYSIAVAVGAADKKELKKNGYTLGDFSAQEDLDGKMQEIYVKAP